MTSGVSFSRPRGSDKVLPDPTSVSQERYEILPLKNLQRTKFNSSDFERSISEMCVDMSEIPILS